MDNNYDNNYEQMPPRPRKRVTRQMLRRRQMGGVAVIGLVLLIIIVLIAKACSSDGTQKTKTPAVTTTAPPVTTMPPPVTTVPVTTINPLYEQVKLSTRSLFLYNIGDTDVAIINGYPEGCSEENEVWKSADESIAKVNEWGYVTAVAPGETYIILSFDNLPGYELEIKVTVADGSGAVTDDVTADVTTKSPEFGLPTINETDDTYTTAVA